MSCEVVSSGKAWYSQALHLGIMVHHDHSFSEVAIAWDPGISQHTKVTNLARLQLACAVDQWLKR
jgi:hypothetical protein